MVKKFKKKPVVIEAVQFEVGPDGDKDHNWYICEEFMGKKCEWAHGQPTIETLEGVHLVSDGDWIIKGVKGEFYPCKPDIFEMTYEPCD